MDIATVISPSGYLDWLIAGSDLVSDGGLFTAVAISLFTDRRANADDLLPDGSADRRGWWGDAYLPPLPDGSPDYIGSRLWLLQRTLQIRETAQRAKVYGDEALAWLTLDGIAEAAGVPVLPTFPGPGLIEILPVVSERTATGIINRRFRALWDMTRATPVSFGLIVGGL